MDRIDAALDEIDEHLDILVAVVVDDDRRDDFFCVFYLWLKERYDTPRLSSWFLLVLFWLFLFLTFLLVEGGGIRLVTEGEIRY